MPEEVRRTVFEISVEGKQAEDSLNRILQAIQKVEQAVVNLGAQIDKGIARLTEPFGKLTESIDRLNQSISSMQSNLGNTQSIQQQRAATQGYVVDLANLRAAMSEFRVGGGGFKVKGVEGGRFISRERFIEEYMAGSIPGYGPAGPAEPFTGGFTPTMQVSGTMMAGAQRPIGESLQATQATLQQEQDAVAALNDGLRKSVAERERAAAAAREELSAAERLAATEQLRAQQMERGAAKRAIGGEELLGRLEPGADPRVRKQLEEAQRQYQESLGKVNKEVAASVPITDDATEAQRKWISEFLRSGKAIEDHYSKIRRGPPVPPGGTDGDGVPGLDEEDDKKISKRDGLLRSIMNTYIRYFAVWQAMRAVRTIATDWMQAHTELDRAMANLQIRLGATGPMLETYIRQVGQISQVTGYARAQAAQAMAIGGAIAPAGGEQLITQRAMEMQRITGVGAEEWVRTITVNLRGFNMEAAETDRLLDVMLAAWSKSGMSMQDFMSAIQLAPGLSMEWNTSLEETYGLIAGVGKTTGQTTQSIQFLFHNLGELSKQADVLQTMGITPRVTIGPEGERVYANMVQLLDEIYQKYGSNERALIKISEAMGLSGRKQQELFITAMRGWPTIRQLIADAGMATGTFTQDLGIMRDTLTTHTDEMKAAWQDMLTSIGDTEALKDLVDVTAMIFKGWQMIVEEIGKVPGAIEEALSIELPDWLKYIVPGGGIKLLAEQYRGSLAGISPVPPSAAGAPPPTAPAGGGVSPPAPAGTAGAPFWVPQPRYQQLPEEITVQQFLAELERVTAEIGKPFQDITGVWHQIDTLDISQRELIIVTDEQNRIMTSVLAYMPAVPAAMQGLNESLKESRVSIDRLRDITPEQFDVAMRTGLPMWEARLAQVPGFKEDKEWQNFFVGQNDVGRRQLATQTAMQYTLQDILDTEKKQLEGMWNIPAGVIMRVPLQSLDLMRWMQQGAGGGMPEGGFPVGPETPTDLMQPVNMAATNLDGSATGLLQAGVNLGNSARDLSNAAAMVGQMGAGAALDKEATEEARRGLKQGVNVGGGVSAGAGGRVEREVQPYPGVPLGPMAEGGGQVNANIKLETVVNLDGRQIARVVEEQQVRDLQNAARGRAVGGLRP